MDAVLGVWPPITADSQLPGYWEDAPFPPAYWPFSFLRTAGHYPSLPISPRVCLSETDGRSILHLDNDLY